MKKKTLLIIAGVVAAIFLLILLASGLPSLLILALSSKKNSTNNGTDPAESTVGYKNAYIGSGVPDVLSEETLAEYTQYLAPANDEFDFLYATDYTCFELVKIHEGRDCSSYEQILGYQDATLEDIRAALDANEHINQTYKDFIYTYASDLRRLYPNVNLAVLCHNLQTLVIDEMTQEQIDKETLSTDSAACYLRYENRICVLENLDLSKSSDDYIVLVHELIHAARSVQIRTEDPSDWNVDIGFYDYHLMGTYAEEGIITNIAYALQGMDKKATFYPMLASYYRIIESCIDYSGEDFFNHSVNYLITKMDEFMGDKQYAYQIVAMIDSQMSLRYTPYQGVDFRDFQPMYEYLAKMYFKKHINSEMTYAQAEAVFDTFYEDITFNFENMNRGYNIDENTFLPTFEAYVASLGIQKT